MKLLLLTLDNDKNMSTTTKAINNDGTFSTVKQIPQKVNCLPCKLDGLSFNYKI